MAKTCLILLAAFVLSASALDDRCNLPIARGFCLAYFPRYGFNPKAGICEKFIYGGCQGNDNRFLTLEECELACMRGDVKN